ncbi:MAG TPA: hypothetical protein VI796_02910, partial [Candidatus Thermoplasmatota archaeon]|nr:hypothetical protein [Candidatus Thermoplasmatota archaeon]
MHPRTASVPLALLLTALLAGCSGGGGGSDSTATTGPSRGPDGEILPEGMVALTYDLDGPVSATLWANDTFALQETCNFDGNVMNSCPEKVTDITGDLPQGVPVEISLDLTYATLSPDVWIFGMEAWVQSEESAFLIYNATYLAGHVTVKILMVPRGTVEVVAIAGGPTGQTPESPYSLRIDITADNATTPPGVPVLVRLDGNTTVEAKTLAGNKVDILVYGPDDVYHGTYSGSHTVPESAASGEYVVLAQQADGP